MEHNRRHGEGRSMAKSVAQKKMVKESRLETEASRFSCNGHEETTRQLE